MCRLFNTGKQLSITVLSESLNQTKMDKSMLNIENLWSF